MGLKDSAESEVWYRARLSQSKQHTASPLRAVNRELKQTMTGTSSATALDNNGVHRDLISNDSDDENENAANMHI